MLPQVAYCQTFPSSPCRAVSRWHEVTSVQASTDSPSTSFSRKFCDDEPIDRFFWRPLCNPSIWMVFWECFQKAPGIKRGSILQNTFLACVWILICRLSPPESEKRLSQTWQLYLSGFCSECIRRTCLTSVDFKLKLFSHLSHLNGFSPVWVSLCRFKSHRFVKDLLQSGSSQWKR